MTDGRGSGRTAVVFARLTGANWLEPGDDECVGDAEAGLAGCTDHVVAGDDGRPQWMGRVRVVMLPVAVFVVACALAVAAL
ncbi:MULTISPECIES: hypothetical protein [unclassified Streptomyces]|uniref:hypothetical protein n=1 Tax=unclassified Streptomyces TaxID=2593676 RepID=UPI002257745B|nr:MULTISPECIES: hypothetical protein [unclassified Streptomyces]MCX5328598.1 hypothetical protein [Streptomyces sp. NBC_00140]MCX5358008.1 hypothetical protein [Streptomyces sp. NBC_00124]